MFASLSLSHKLEPVFFSIDIGASCHRVRAQLESFGPPHRFRIDPVRTPDHVSEESRPKAVQSDQPIAAIAGRANDEVVARKSAPRAQDIGGGNSGAVGADNDDAFCAS